MLNDPRTVLCERRKLSWPKKWPRAVYVCTVAATAPYFEQQVKHQYQHRDRPIWFGKTINVPLSLNNRDYKVPTGRDIRKSPRILNRGGTNSTTSIDTRRRATSNFTVTMRKIRRVHIKDALFTSYNASTNSSLDRPRSRSHRRKHD